MTINRRNFIPVRRVASVIGLAILAGCTSAKVTPRDPAAAYADLPQSALNSPRLSGAARARIAAAAPEARERGIAGLERQLQDSPDDSELRQAVCEWHLRPAGQLERRTPEKALGHYLAAAEFSYPAAMIATDGGDTLRGIYNHSCGQVATALRESNPDWARSRQVPTDRGDYTIEIDAHSPRAIDPGFFDDQAADSVRVRGIDERQQSAGLGAALIGYRQATESRLAETPNMPTAGFGMPLNATLEFGSGGTVKIAFHDLMLGDEATLGGRRVKLAGDFTAPIARFIQENPTSSGASGFFSPDRSKAKPGLYRLDPFRPNKIPVVFVHGLLSHPSGWIETYNELLSDATIRENFQFWFALYTTGEPVIYNAARLRSWLQEMHSHYDPRGSNRNMDNMVVIGHSMGGLLTSFQIREGGDRIWNQLFDEDIDGLGLSEELRERWRRLVYFEPDRHITRAIFAATPHLGSPVTQSTIGRLGDSLVRLPAEIVSLDILRSRPEAVGALTDVGAQLLSKPESSIDALRETNEGLRILSELPIGKGVSYHSIIGDRGKGDGQERSDGVVPYASAHLEGAASEKIVPSDHEFHKHPEGIAEIRRILLLHLREAGRLN